jgi:hypothetical protein
MTNSSERSLRAFARRRKLRVQSCMVVYLHPSEVALVAVNVRHKDRKCRMMASADRLVLTGKVEVPVFFSVGAIHPMLITTSAVDIGTDAALRVYASPGFEAAVRDWLRNERHLEKVLALRLRLGESLHVARNETMLVFRPDRDIDDALENFTALLEVISATRPNMKRATTYLLPEGFRDLESIAARWATQDDGDREDSLRRAGAKVRAQLLAAILPRLDDINDYLDHQRQPFSEEAIRLQTIGELGAELAVARDRGLI